MPKKDMTPEERKAWGEKMKAARAARQNKVQEVAEMGTEDKDDSGNITLSKEQYEALMNRLSAIEAAPKAEQIPQTPPSVQPNSNAALDAQGRPVGIIEKFSIDPAHYVDPCEELFTIFDTTPQLRRFGLRANYDLKWTVTPTRYQTVFGTWYIEPRFELIVYRRRFDEDGNELPSKLVLGRDSFFEDPAANLIEAELAGVDYNDENMTASQFSDRMRMYRYKTFVTEVVNPKRPTGKAARNKLEVIGGKAYEVEEGSSIIN